MKLGTLLSTFAVTAMLATGAHAKNPFLTKKFWKEATIEDVQAKLDEGYSLLEKQKIGRQGLHYALRGKASIEVMRWLLEQGLPYRPEGGKGVYAELYAARYGDLELIKLFAEFGADYQVSDYMGETPQYWLSKNKKFRPGIVEYFEEIGLDFNEQNRLGITPLGAFAYNKRAMKMFELLEDKGYDPGYIDGEGRDLFMRALTSNDNVEMLEKFYNMSEDPEVADNYGYAGVLLTVADEATSEERLAFLESKGYDLTITNDRGQTALHMLMANREEEAEGYDALMKRGFDVNAVDNAGNTPLLLALSFKEPAVIETLLDAGAKPTAANDKGVTPLLAALLRGDDFTAVIDRLIAAGADLSAKDAKGGTALTYAVKGGQPIELLQKIVDAGVDLNAKDGEETTALMHAALLGKKPEVIEFLLAAGADKSIKDVFDDTAAQMAMDNAALKGSQVIAKLQ
ncbi:ankyrin repeat domain-containing protein [Motiliproteus coralliicola]|uniref:Ankyrin repeat domain-containing protein n=1 Tax=Motiliproteus coralliicola TaxID=2283196 RepID=A0A369WAA5_9GAMM|nr:ankyrin repeat domain-containing protein [Motiliproteus coralliicola]RDE18938.1 ankyrin repeat domain-containing protein [Motiliproteus coralliicola]